MIPTIKARYIAPSTPSMPYGHVEITINGVHFEFGTSDTIIGSLDEFRAQMVALGFDAATLLWAIRAQLEALPLGSMATVPAPTCPLLISEAV